jgi:membrane protein
MARLRDVPFVLRTVGPVRFVRNVINEVMDDDVLTMAAAMAYSWIFAIFPFLIFLISLTPMLPQQYRDGAIDFIKDSVATLPKAAGETILTNVDAILNQKQAAVLSLSLLITLWAAGGGMRATMSALDRCYDVNRGRPFWLNWLVALAMTVVSILMIICVIVLIPIGNIGLNTLQRWIERGSDQQWLRDFQQWMNIEEFTNVRWWVDLFRYSIGATLLMIVVSMVYQFGPSVRRRWALITPGAVFCVLAVFVIGYGFNYYVSRLGEAGYLKTYGAIAGVILLLMVFYIYATVFLIGAEINSEIDFAVTEAALKAQANGDPLPKLFDTEEAADFKKQMAKRRVVVREGDDTQA